MKNQLIEHLLIILLIKNIMYNRYFNFGNSYPEILNQYLKCTKKKSYNESIQLLDHISPKNSIKDLIKNIEIYSRIRTESNKIDKKVVCNLSEKLVINSTCEYIFKQFNNPTIKLDDLISGTDEEINIQLSNILKF